ncbi:MAG: hypothetical protein C5B53_01620 [Candidatus Melainabacteria bacterium]|nr:MAG: hypothetical protein C5B53_01620 [Candidatus Melainabacteria bacterium]
MRLRPLVLSLILCFALSLLSSAPVQAQWGFSLRKPLYLLKISHGADHFQTNSEAEGTEKLRQEWDTWMQKGRIALELHLYGRGGNFFSGAFLIAELLDDPDLEQKTLDTAENLYLSIKEKEKQNPISVVPRDFLIGFVIACAIIILFVVQGIEWLPWRLVVAVVLVGVIGLLVYSQIDRQDQINRLGEAVTRFKKSVEDRHHQSESPYKMGSWGYEIN